MEHLDVYAKVIDGKIKEFPVYKLHIENRGHSFFDYKKVVFEEKPFIPLFKTVVPEPYFDGDNVFVKWKLIDKSLNLLLNELNAPTFLDPSHKDYLETVTIYNIPFTITEQLFALIKKYVSEKLESFAKSKDYSDSLSLVSYEKSTVDNFREDAETFILLRDQCWTSIHSYLDILSAGGSPIPKSTDDIDLIIPQLTWSITPP